MLLVERKGKLKWNSANKKRYLDLGYVFTKMGDEFLVEIEHLKDNTRAVVSVLCDFCKINEKQIFYMQYTHNQKRSISKLDCCDECFSLKQKDSFKIKYGIDNPAKLDVTKQKMKETNMEKYGVENLMQKKEIAVNRTSKMFKTKYEKGNAPSSKQQDYLASLLNGEKNYPINNIVIDIAFIEELIYIEYDGSGHRLSVDFGIMTDEEFDRKEMLRKYVLKKKGWKEIRIISVNDFLPQDEIILTLISECKEYLSTGHSWVEIDIDNSIFKCKEYIKKIELGKLRKIKYECVEVK